jgi:hypothetical protein
MRRRAETPEAHADRLRVVLGGSDSHPEPEAA